MLLALTLSLLVFLGLAFRGLGFLAWLTGAGVLLVGWRLTGVAHPALFAACAIALVALAALFGLPPLRRQIASRFIMPIFAKVLPRMSDTERIALEAGTVWWDGELFSGAPTGGRCSTFRSSRSRRRSARSSTGPVEELCRELDDWEVQQQRDLPPEIWDFLKRSASSG